jgi:hypothetical protein
MRKQIWAGALVLALMPAGIAMAQPSPEQAGADPKMAPQAPSQVSATAIPGSSPQTLPSTISAENAAKDKHWWLDRGQALSPEQKQLIYRSLARGQTANAPDKRIHGVLSEELPAEVTPQEFPSELTAQVPSFRGLKYMMLGDKVLVVNPANKTVGAIITQ